MSEEETPPAAGNGASGNGHQAGNGKSESRFARARRITSRSPLPNAPPPPGATPPEMGCIGCVIGAVIVIVSLIIWGYIYWRTADQFQPPPPLRDVSVQEQLRRDREEQAGDRTR